MESVLKVSIIAFALSACAETQTPKTVPENVLTSQAAVSEFLLDRPFAEFSNSLKTQMTATFQSNGIWKQVRDDSGSQVGNSRFTLREDGRFCGQAAGRCFYIRPDGRDFTLVNLNGSFGKSFKAK